MEFTDLKKIWDDHAQEHYYQINEVQLYKRVVRNGQNVRRIVNLFDWGMTGILFILAAVSLGEGIWDKEYYQIPESIILFVVVIYLLLDRHRRLQLAKKAPQSLKEELRKATYMLDYHISRRRNFIWWFILPLILTTFIHMLYTYQGKPWWLWPLSFGAFGFSYWMVDKELNQQILPKREDLHALQKLLED